jgi:hypothetical protein
MNSKMDFFGCKKQSKKPMLYFALTFFKITNDNEQKAQNPSHFITRKKVYHRLLIDCPLSPLKRKNIPGARSE